MCQFTNTERPQLERNTLKFLFLFIERSKDPFFEIEKWLLYLIYPFLWVFAFPVENQNPFYLAAKQLVIKRRQFLCTRFVYIGGIAIVEFSDNIPNETDFDLARSYIRHFVPKSETF